MSALGFTVSMLAAEIDAFRARCEERGEVATKLIPAVARSLTAKLALLKDVTADNSLTLICAAEAALGDHASAFETAVMLRLENCLTADLHKTAQLGQVLQHLDNYLTQEHLLKLGLSSTPLSRERLVIDLLESLGITRVHVKTVASIEAVLLHAETDLTHVMPNYDDIYAHGRKMSSNFIATRTPIVNGLITYPKFPKDLPPDLFAFVYPDPLDPPITGSLPRFAMLRLHHVPLRTTSKLLQRNFKVGAANAMSRGASFVHPGADRQALCDAGGRSVINLGDLRSLRGTGRHNDELSLYGGGSSSACGDYNDRAFLLRRLQELDGTADNQQMHHKGPPPIGDIHSASVHAATAAEGKASEAERTRKLAAENAERDRAALAADTEVTSLKDLLSQSEAKLAAALAGRSNDTSSDMLADGAHALVAVSAKAPLPGTEAHEEHMIQVQLVREQQKKEDQKEQRRLTRELEKNALAAKRIAATPHGKGSLPPLATTPPPLSKSMCRTDMNPNFSCEWSRFQFLARSGRKGDESIPFKFDDHGGIEGAQQACVAYVAAWREKLGLPSKSRAAVGVASTPAKAGKSGVRGAPKPVAPTGRGRGSPPARMVVKAKCSKRAHARGRGRGGKVAGRA